MRNIPMVQGSMYDLETLYVLSEIQKYDPELATHCINTENYVRNMITYLGKEDEDLYTAALYCSSKSRDLNGESVQKTF